MRGQEQVLTRADVLVPKGFLSTLGMKSDAVLSSTAMSKRALILIALSLAVMVFLVLVMPQVDLDDGVLRDVQWQVQMLVFALLATALIIHLPMTIVRSAGNHHPADAPPGALPLLSSSMLRC
jgi:NADH:ubiquinone oxidoreductase subunit 6 (subunit J)